MKQVLVLRSELKKKKGVKLRIGFFARVIKFIEWIQGGTHGPLYDWE